MVINIIYRTRTVRTSRQIGPKGCALPPHRSGGYDENHTLHTAPPWCVIFYNHFTISFHLAERRRRCFASRKIITIIKVTRWRERVVCCNCTTIFDTSTSRFTTRRNRTTVGAASGINLERDFGARETISHGGGAASVLHPHHVRYTQARIYEGGGWSDGQSPLAALFAKGFGGGNLLKGQKCKYIIFIVHFTV